MPQNESTEVYTDGGSRGNPGSGGAGFVIKEKNSSRGYYFYIGECTNNEAEYNALILALEKVLEHGIKKAQFYSDSQLLCNQINGIYKVKNERLKKLFNKANNLINDFTNFSISHIRREKNKDADKLANIAMNKRSHGEIDFTVAK